MQPGLTAVGTHMPYGITQCYLPPGRFDIPALTPVEAGTRFLQPPRETRLSWLDSAVGAQPVPKSAYRSGCRDKHNRPR